MSAFFVLIVLVNVIYQIQANPIPSTLSLNPELTSTSPPQEFSYVHQIASLFTELTDCFDRKLVPFMQQMDEKAQAQALLNMLTTNIHFMYELLAEHNHEYGPGRH
ncbi:hypothetical protein O0L34_g17320 [Tuta absoluta]|nr:hypothetical protein O0L34_g17320 [Tuta absoluta]